MSAVPRVSLVMAAYNSAATVAETLESCLAQSYGNFEVVVVDDGSKDDTPRVLASFGERIRVVRQENAGLATARNVGMRAATGEYLAWMDADDLCHPDRLHLGAAVLTARPDVLLVSSDFSAFNDQGEIEPTHIRTYYGSMRHFGSPERIYPEVLDPAACAGAPARVGSVYECLLHGNFVHPPTVMMRRSGFELAGWFNPEIRASSDYDLIMRLARRGPFAFIDRPLLRYRLSATQMSRSAAGGRIPLETIRILERVRQDEPEVWARNREMLRERFAASYINAAEYTDRREKRRVLGLLAKAARYRLHPIDTLRVLLKILVPRSVVTAARSLAHLGSARH